MFKVGDIVVIKSIKTEGLILNIGNDLETEKIKYCIIDTDNLIHFTEENNLDKIGTLDEFFEDFSEDDVKCSDA